MANQMYASSSSSSSLMLSNEVPSGFILVPERCLLIRHEVTGKLVEHIVPSGYLFKPRDWELIVYYVNKKNSCHPPDIDFGFYNVDDNFPEGLPADYKFAKGKKYFFTKRIYIGSKRKRSTSAGRWDEKKRSKIIYGGQVIGLKRTSYFLEGKDKKKKSKWCMHEYSSIEHKMNDYVLCVIYENKAYQEHGTPESITPTAPLHQIQLGDFDSNPHIDPLNSEASDAFLANFFSYLYAEEVQADQA